MPVKNLARQLMPRRLWAWLRVARLRGSILAYRPRCATHSYGGFPLKVWLADPLGEGWYDRDWPILEEIALLARHRLRPGARVFDLGAHQCVVALMLSRIVGPAGSVVAVEANAHNAAVGRRNKELNRTEQLMVVRAAAAERSGAISFNRGLNGQIDDGSDGWGRVEVPAVSVDDLAFKHGQPDVLFIDVEGFEVAVLRGAARTLEARPDCFVEVHLGGKLEKFGGSAAAVLSFFPEDRYRRFLADPERGKEFAPLADPSAVPGHRCFLVALGRGRTGG